MMDEVIINASTAAAGNATWNMSVEQLLLERLGPRSKDTWSAVVLTVVYSVIFLSGSVGNICTCIVIVRNHCMQTTTNYYLFSLAVSDLMLLFFGLPPEMFTIWLAYPWRFGEAFCYIRHTILELTSYASVLTITAFTVERYIAVCRPLLSHKIAVLSRAVKIIVCIWVVSLVVALPYAVHTRLFYAVTWPPTGQPLTDSLMCSIPMKWLEGRMSYMFQISTFLFFLAPVTLIICLYILIGIAVRRSPLSRGSSDEHSQCHSMKHTSLPHQPRRVVIRMLVAVTVAFIICWAPFHTQRLMVLYVHRWTPELLAAQSHIFYVSGVLYFVSSTVNPILYNVISRRYRVAFRQTICGSCRQDRPGSFVSRQSQGSHVTHRKVSRPGGGGDQTYQQQQQQQQHSLLDKDSPQTATHCRRPHTFSQQRSVISETEKRSCISPGRKHPGSKAGLFPGVLRRKRRKGVGGGLLNTCTAPGGGGGAETSRSLEDVSQHNNHNYIKLQALPAANRRRQLPVESRPCSPNTATTTTTITTPNHCNNTLHVATLPHQPHDETLALVGEPNELHRNYSSAADRAVAVAADRAASKEGEVGTPAASRLVAAVVVMEKTATHPGHNLPRKQRNDSNDNSFRTDGQEGVVLERTPNGVVGRDGGGGGGAMVVLGEKRTPYYGPTSSTSTSSSSSRAPPPPLPPPPSSWHQHSMARDSASSGSLCKQCLTNTAPAAANGSTPFSDVEAYHVGFDVSMPHSHL
ncbi:uncharacterized protein LOC143282893 [Babylonia areolata]|uniref:uncharacterized protein LOC143282893 n=1 Tax=Babylonia areolata TaxID=304850 RepID=UPI003FD21E79